MITYDAFVKKYNGKGIDYDGYFGFQCMDLYHQYDKECVGSANYSAAGAKNVWNRYDKNFYDRISNGPTNFPQKGDVVIWGVGVGLYGHIAVCDFADSVSLKSFDQNWPVGTISHLQNHNYRGVLGWLRPKKKVTEQTPTIQTIPQETPETVISPPETPPTNNAEVVLDSSDPIVVDPPIESPDIVDTSSTGFAVGNAETPTSQEVVETVPEPTLIQFDPLERLTRAIFNLFKRLLGK